MSLHENAFMQENFATVYLMFQKKKKSGVSNNLRKWQKE